MHRSTMTSYKTVDGPAPTGANGEEEQADTPVLAGENAGVKLGAGAWTVAMLGLSTVVAGLLM